MGAYDLDALDLDNEAEEIAELTGGEVLDPKMPAIKYYEDGPALGNDPSRLGWPPSLPVELALQQGTPREICEAYGIDRQRWDHIRTNPMFVAELNRTVEAMRGEGMAFKARSQLQANELLKQSWKIIHDKATPANVAADLIKATIRWSGLDASKDASLSGKSVGGFAIQINLN